MKAQSLSIIAALLLGSGLSAYAQMGQGSSPRGYSSAPTRSTPSVSGGGGSTYSSSPSRSTPSSSGSSDTYRGSSSSGSNSSSGSSRGGSSSSSSPSNNNSGSYSNGGYNNNNGYYGNNSYNNGGYSSAPGTSGSNSTVTSGGSGSNPAYYPQQGDAETNRNNSIKDIHKALSAFDQSKQTYTVSGTQPSTVTGLGGTRMNINPADLVTADGQPVSGDITVELKELDGPGKMALAGAPTMSNGDVLISGGSYYFGMSAGGQELKLKDGKTMEVQLPQLVNDPDMQVYMGEVDKNGRVNWQPTGKPLTGLGATTNGNEMGNTRPNNEGGNNNGGTTTNGGVRNQGGSNNTNNTGDGRTNTNTWGNSAFTYYSPTTINNLGWVNCDKGFRGGVKMFVEVEGVDPTNTQVFVVYKDVKSLVEGQPEQGFSSNNFIFTNIPNNQPVKIVAISKANGVTYTGMLETKTKARAKFLVPLTQSSDADAAKLFE